MRRGAEAALHAEARATSDAAVTGARYRWSQMGDDQAIWSSTWSTRT